MKKNPSMSFFPLQLSAVAGVLTAFCALLAQVPPFTVIVRGLLAVLVFALFGQLLLYLWQSLNTPEQAKTEPVSPDSAPEEADAALRAATISIPASPAGLADLSPPPLSYSLESPKVKIPSQVLPVTNPVTKTVQPPTTGKK